jgi:hypothetical protein
MKKDYMFIRGARIAKQLEQFLAETTYAELERNTLNSMPGENRANATNSVQIRDLQLIPYENALGVNSVVNSINSGSSYQPQVMFLDVEYINRDQQDADQLETDPRSVTFQGPDGKDYTIMPISLARNNCKVRCTCLDFRWRFAMYNDQDGSLFGEGPGLYQKKTDRQPNNPQRVPGVCKHILKLVDELKRNNIVQL